ncbi:hypothetical protein DSCW_41770 [Desulfosarcina widdelii]|uniref:Uncharacterized protein n=1 Tax=Desulfosarcina widdelii TaxID=947919 RepID=A0A5K7Z7N6_9BACT|nr:hypothetical protein [Desulfosarcina widdelii]BBO76760.1 hypothetical protein DSCW_41770 [Desulfosarcina widdelii]
MTTVPLASHELKNGLTMVFVDNSKKIAADRWYINIRVEIRIPVQKKWFATGSVDDGEFKAILDTLGEEVIFSQKKERNFISEEAKDKIVKDICNRALQTGLTYCASDTFAARTILKAFRDKSRQHPYHEK